MQIIKQIKNEDSKKIWNSEYVKIAIEAIENGYELIESPFYEKDINFRKGNLLFEYTDFELQEIKKCAKDVVYFADNHAFTMTDDGMQQIVLRDYQKDVLRTYQNEKEIVFMASRQIGKCGFYNTKCVIYNTKTGEKTETTIGNLYYKTLKRPNFAQTIKHFLYNLLC